MIILAERSCGCTMIKENNKWRYMYYCDHPDCRERKDKEIGNGKSMDPEKYPYFYKMYKGKTYKNLIEQTENFKTKVALANL